MKSQNINILRTCFIITIASNLVIYIAQPLNILFLQTIASRCFIISNVVAFFYVFLYNVKARSKNNTIYKIIIILAIVFSSTISYLLSSGGVYDYIIRLLCYLALPFYFLYIDYVKLDKRLLDTIFFITFLTSLFFIYLSFTEYAYSGYENFLGTQQAWLTLGYDNPNQTGMYLLLTMIILICALHYYEMTNIRIIILIDILFIAKLLIETSSRACIFSGIFVFIITFVKKKFNLSKYTVILIMLIPLIFMIGYPYFYDSFLKQYSFEVFGKQDISSRALMIKWVLSSLDGSYLFGNYGVNKLSNSHNGTLSIYSSLGVVGLILFYIYFFVAYFDLLKKIKSKTASIAFIGLLAIFIQSTVEAAFFTGGSMYAGTLSILIYLAKLDLEGINKT